MQDSPDRSIIDDFEIIAWIIPAHFLPFACLEYGGPLQPPGLIGRGRRCLSGLLSLDDPKHPDPEFGACTLSGQSFDASVVSCHDSGIGPVHFDHFAGQRHLGGSAGLDPRLVGRRLYSRPFQWSARSAMSAVAPKLVSTGRTIGGTIQALIIGVIPRRFSG
jgi:hypothetical protein